MNFRLLSELLTLPLEVRKEKKREGRKGSPHKRILVYKYTQNKPRMHTTYMEISQVPKAKLELLACVLPETESAADILMKT